MKTRILLPSALLGLASLALAGPGFLGTKADPTPTKGAEAPIGILPMIQMMVALAIVIGLVKWVLPRFLGRMTPKGKGDIAVEMTTALGPATLHVVTVRGRTMLLGVTPQNVGLIAELTEDNGAFAERLTFATAAIEVEEPPRGSAPKDDNPPSPRSDVELALERLRKLETR
jgi:flagellar biogenesis protein FliO